MTASKPVRRVGRPRKVTLASAAWPVKAKARKRGRRLLPFGAVIGASGRQSALARSHRLIDTFDAARRNGASTAEAYRLAADDLGIHERTAQTAIAKHRRLLRQAERVAAMFKDIPKFYNC